LHYYQNIIEEVFSYALRIHSQRPDKSQDEGRTKPNPPPARLFWLGGRNRRSDILSHARDPCLVDGFADHTREAAREKPSVLETLRVNAEKSRQQFSGQGKKEPQKAKRQEL